MTLIPILLESAPRAALDARALGTLATIVLVLALLHLGLPRFRGWLERKERLVGSVGGGLMSAYVFLHLLPELDEGQAVIGRSIYGIALLGFLLFDGIERWAWTRTKDAEPEARRKASFPHRVVLAAGYNFLILYSLPEAIYDSYLVVYLMLLTFVLHLVHVADSLSGLDEHAYDRWGRHVLVLGLVAGAALHAAAPPSLRVVNVSTALLSGSILFTVFKEQLGEYEKTSYRMYLGGVLAYFCILRGLLPYLGS